VDGNWALATPYPSVPYNQPAPNPCLLTTFGPAWVDAPWFSWFNPEDGVSQCITPEVEGPVAAGGWYVYATTFPIPPIAPGSSRYVLTVVGQLLVDNNVGALYLGDAASCRPVAIPAATGFSAWSPFSFAALVTPETRAFLFFVAYNDEQSYGNPTGLRVEFTSAYLTPE
jgi:hypothetical protein